MDSPEQRVFRERQFIRKYDDEGRLVQATETDNFKTYCEACWDAKPSNAK